ncbi:GntR family transcriptional regulator [Paenibacillus protaetiae]|uniref:GntR family transcriptional regulator n=1 Tax=Paenibacillus protaetiae TaxID=2509456 RepID=A0A4P6EW66_9BACL|nr:GntR family transcriptional regulator [Paenibacillus protaetiae]QAY66926.1 GntR family transcriptional regulator [Paenibacillus protaetiae]
MKEGAPTLVETAYRHLRLQLIDGHILPGTMLSENDIASELGMSRTPVRVAISRLESDGLVQSLQKRGVLVKEVSYRESIELLELILAAQLYAASLMETEGFKELARLQDIFRSQEAATKSGDYAAYVQCNLNFTRCFISNIANVAMLKALEGPFNKAAVFAMVNYHKTPDAPHYSATPFNESLLRAVEKEDYAEVRAILQRFSLKVREMRTFY